MYDILIHFEQSASFLNPMVLLGLGTAGVLMGILLWLGGSFGGRFSVSLVVLLIGALTGLCFLSPAMALGMGLVLAVLALIFVRLFTGLVSGILCLLLVMNGFQWMMASDTPVEETESWIIQVPEEGNMDTQTTLLTLKDMMRALGRAGIRDLQPIALIRCLYLLGLFLAIGFVCWFIRPVGVALCCAITGTLLIVFGMVLILSFKGARPMGYIAARETFCVGVAGVMSIFGILEQLLLCRRAGKRSVAKPADKS